LIGGKGELPGGVLLTSVRLWLDWKMTNVLPKAGGIDDQDPEFMRDLRTITGIENQMQNQKQQQAQLKEELMRKMGRRK
jgi:hypothetical protein